MASTCISARTRSLRISFPSANAAKHQNSHRHCQSVRVLRAVSLFHVPALYSFAFFLSLFTSFIIERRSPGSSYYLFFFSFNFLLLVFKLLLPPPLPIQFLRQRSVAIDIETSFGGSLPFAAVSRNQANNVTYFMCSIRGERNADYRALHDA